MAVCGAFFLCEEVKLYVPALVRDETRGKYVSGTAVPYVAGDGVGLFLFALIASAANVIIRVSIRPRMPKIATQTANRKK